MPISDRHSAVVGGVGSVLPCSGLALNCTGATVCDAGADVATGPAGVAATTLRPPAATTLAITSNRTGRKAMASSSMQGTHHRVGAWTGADRPVVHREQAYRRCIVNRFDTDRGKGPKVVTQVLR